MSKFRDNWERDAPKRKAGNEAEILFLNQLVGKTIQSVDKNLQNCTIVFSDGTRLELISNCCEGYDLELEFYINDVSTTKVYNDAYNSASRL